MYWVIKFDNRYYSGRMTLREGVFHPVMVSRAEAKSYKNERQAVMAAEKVKNTCKGIDGYTIEKE